VSLAERVGQNLPSPSFIQALDRVLEAQGALIELRNQAKNEQHGKRRQISDAPCYYQTSHSPSPPENRPGADLANILDDSARESAEMLAWADVSNVGDLTIEQIHADLRRITNLYLKTATAPLLTRILSLRARVFGILTSGRQKPEQSQELHSASGWATTLLAWISIDLSNPDIADEHLRAAWVFADNSEQDDLKAWIRATQHTSAFWKDDFSRAAKFAQDGLRYARGGSAGLFLNSALALDLARSGRTEVATEVLSTAQHLAENPSTSSDALGGPFMCSYGRAAGFWSDTHLAVGDWRRALEYADSAIAGFEILPPDQRNLGSERMVRCQQVKAHLIAGEIDGASAAIVPVLATSPEHRIRPLIHRVVEISRLAQRHSDAAPQKIRRMQGEISDFIRARQPIAIDAGVTIVGDENR
jgi:hypothetical protein